jgi:hypothetical protein
MFKWLSYDEVMALAVDFVASGPHWEEYASVPAEWMGERIQTETAIRLAIELAKARGVHPAPKEEEVQQLATVSVEEAYHDHYESRLEAYIEEGYR